VSRASFHLATAHLHLLDAIEDVAQEPLTGNDLHAQFVASHIRVVLDELDELLATAGDRGSELEMVA
jgi:hypothetical protein